MLECRSGMERARTCIATGPGRNHPEFASLGFVGFELRA